MLCEISTNIIGAELPANFRETGNDNAPALVVYLPIGVVNAAGQYSR